MNLAILITFLPREPVARGIFKLAISYRLSAVSSQLMLIANAHS